MTVHLSQSLPKTTIHAFEPMPDNRSVFKRISEKFRLKNVVFHEIALGDQEGTVQMILPQKDGAKMQGLSHVKHETITEWNEGEECEVPIQLLDNLLHGTSIQGIKMDVENFEYFVLKGGENLIAQSHPIIYTELWENENRDKCFAFLDQLGYQAHVVTGNQLELYDSTKHRRQNFIFIAN